MFIYINSFWRKVPLLKLFRHRQFQTSVKLALTGWDWVFYLMHTKDDVFEFTFCVKFLFRFLPRSPSPPPPPPRQIEGAIFAPASPTPLETCEACHELVPLTGLLQATCQNDHTWSRCGLTLCLATDARCSSCIQCGIMHSLSMWQLVRLVEYKLSFYSG